MVIEHDFIDMQKCKSCVWEVQCETVKPPGWRLEQDIWYPKLKGFTYTCDARVTFVCHAVHILAASQDSLFHVAYVYLILITNQHRVVDYTFKMAKTRGFEDMQVQLEAQQPWLTVKTYRDLSVFPFLTHPMHNCCQGHIHGLDRVKIYVSMCVCDLSRQEARLGFLWVKNMLHELVKYNGKVSTCIATLSRQQQNISTVHLV